MVAENTRPMVIFMLEPGDMAKCMEKESGHFLKMEISTLENGKMESNMDMGGQRTPPVTNLLVSGKMEKEKVERMWKFVHHVGYHQRTDTFGEIGEWHVCIMYV